MKDALLEAERAKYERVWAFREYRRHSPGAGLCERAYSAMGMRPGELLADFGSGTARATAWFQGRGLDATAIDFVPSARETDVPFVEACLWAMPDDLGPFDWGYCCDVMEHIPESHVGAVLEGISARVDRACFFQIALFHDGMGRLVGKPLHLTVRPASWWQRIVQDHFAEVEVLPSDGRHFVAVCWNRR